MSLELVQPHDNIERQALEDEITQLLNEINRLKEDMFELYQKNKDNIIFKGYDITKNVSDNNKTMCIPARLKKKQKINKNDRMCLNFYRKFLKVFCRSKLDTMRFSFPRFDKEQYGLQFRCMAIGKYFLEKCYLPHTFNMNDEKQNHCPVTYDEIPKYIEIVMDNINAYSLREKQVEDLKNITNKQIHISHSLCYTDIDINFKILTLDSNVRKCVNVNLFYPLLNVLPTTIEITLDGNILLKQHLEAMFDVFKEDTLINAYKKVFVDSDEIKFLN